MHGAISRPANVDTLLNLWTLIMHGYTSAGTRGNEKIFMWCWCIPKYLRMLAA